MKILKLLILLVVFGYSINCSSQDLQKKANEPIYIVEDFAKSVFSSIKNNNFDTFIGLLPSPPFIIDIKSIDPTATDLSITKESFLNYKSNYQYGFNEIISQINKEGIILNDIKLDKINVEYESRSKFQIVEIYLIISTMKGDYKIRIEDCFKVEGKYFPEQLKWEGIIKYD